MAQFKEKPPEVEIEPPTREELLAHATLGEMDELEVTCKHKACDRKVSRSLLIFHRMI